jgi:hypothetical protein
MRALEFFPPRRMIDLHFFCFLLRILQCKYLDITPLKISPVAKYISWCLPLFFHLPFSTHFLQRKLFFLPVNEMLVLLLVMSAHFAATLILPLSLFSFRKPRHKIHSPSSNTPYQKYFPFRHNSYISLPPCRPGVVSSLPRCDLYPPRQVIQSSRLYQWKKDGSSTSKTYQRKATQMQLQERDSIVVESLGHKKKGPTVL